MSNKPIFTCDPADLYDAERAAAFLDVPVRQMRLYIEKNNVPSYVIPANEGQRGLPTKHVIMKPDLIAFKQQRDKEAAWPREKQVMLANLNTWIGRESNRLQRLLALQEQARNDYNNCPKDATMQENNKLRKAVKSANNKVKFSEYRITDYKAKLKALKESD
jgi:hypothetical protein